MNRYHSSKLLLQRSGFLSSTSSSLSSFVNGTFYGGTSSSSISSRQRVGMIISPTSSSSSLLLALSSSSKSRPSFLSLITRSKHSSTQIKRLFKKNPARRRIELREQQQQQDQEIGVVASRIPQAKYAPILTEPIKILPNGWIPPPPSSTTIPGYPFQVSRTRNKPNNAIGFLPVYSEFR